MIVGQEYMFRGRVVLVSEIVPGRGVRIQSERTPGVRVTSWVTSPRSIRELERSPQVMPPAAAIEDSPAREILNILKREGACQVCYGRPPAMIYASIIKADRFPDGSVDRYQVQQLYMDERGYMRSRPVRWVSARYLHKNLVSILTDEEVIRWIKTMGGKFSSSSHK